MANESDGGYLLTPDLEVICFECYEPDQEKRQEITRGAIRASLFWFREEHGRLPKTSTELVAWLSENVGGERRPLHLTGPMPEEDAD
jgi:hypothetical protein